MKHLILLLDRFKEAMLNKFIERHEQAIKRWGSSVIDDNFDWNNLNIEHIEEHLREEIAEWLQAKPWERAKEDIDMANMAFLDWIGRTDIVKPSCKECGRELVVMAENGNGNPILDCLHGVTSTFTGHNTGY